MSADSEVDETDAAVDQHAFEELVFGGEVLLPEYQVGFERASWTAAATHW
jgi:hypothetical protein